MLLLATAAFACPPTAEGVEAARALFQDAEIDDARQVTQQTLDELACQTQVVERGVLLELYRLDAQIALANLDKKGATYATIRSVVVDPASVPTADYGPELADLHTVWAERLAGSSIELSVSGGGIVYLDGLPLQEGERMRTVRGEHLVQIDAGMSVVSTLTDLDQDQTVITGLPSREPQQPSPSPVSEPVPLRDLDGPDPNPERRRRKPSAVLMVVGGSLAAVGGAALGYAWYRDEVVFPRKTFSDERAVDREATSIRALYGTGYGVGGLGAVVFGVGAVGIPVRVEATWRF